MLAGAFKKTCVHESVVFIALRTACKGRGLCFEGGAFSPQKPGAFLSNQGRGRSLGGAFELDKAKKTSKHGVFR